MHDLAKLWEFGVWLHLRLVTCFVTWLDEKTGQLAKITLDDNNNPTWISVLQSPKCEYWIARVCEELKSLKDLQVCILVPWSNVPHGHHPLKDKLVCKQKCDNAGNIFCYKVWYVVKGLAQHYMIDYDKTAAPTTCLEFFCSILHIAAILNWDIQHVDIRPAFLHGVLPKSEVVFIKQPSGFKVAEKYD